MQGKKFPIWLILFAVWTIFVIQGIWMQVREVQKLSYSQFLADVDQNKVDNLTVTEHEITGDLNVNGKTVPFATTRVEQQNLAQLLAARHIKFSGATENNFFRDLLSWVIPAAIFFGLWMLFLNRATDKDGMMGGVMSIGRSKARVYVEEKEKTTFADVAGVDEAKEELQEVVTFLKEPDRYRKLGGRMPKGVLLVGPPGTGKTLLARAVAGEAGVPFFSISGSEFVELFVGVGAARVRDLFEQSMKKSPCIVFIDELDALGKARGFGMQGSHDEKEQTLNQLLVELDGFDARKGMVVLAATNRPEILDPALLRAGRFDRQVLVDRPDKKGRLEILNVHIRSIVIGADVDREAIAQATAGFTGADLANLVNEAALLAARRGADRVTMIDFNEGIERIVAGLEKKNRLLNEEERKRVAYHEMGHALLAISLPGSDPVHKVSIIPRGSAALGYTMQRPTEDRFLMSRTELENRLVVLLGGRSAELIIFNQVSTGAADDLSKATEIARNMITRYGMADRMGPVTYENEPNGFLQKQYMATLQERLYSEETAREIDMEVRKLVEAANKRAMSMLGERRALLERAAKRLLEKETLTKEELDEIVDAEVPRWNTNRPATDVVPIQNDQQKAV
ncbi:MAG TPA: ATP-dependent zinc metalloprotease FtsH [Candidatus Obscuribacterales bacterium]